MNRIQIEATATRDYLEQMTKVVFQAGMGRAVVEAKWEGFLEAFAEFDPPTVAGFTADDVDRLCSDSRVIRNRRKIEATVHNAGRLVELEDEPGFVSWLRGHDDEPSQAAALRREFSYLGPAAVEEFLWVVGERVERSCAR